MSLWIICKNKGGIAYTRNCPGWNRREIIKQCTVMVDGRYIESQKDIALKWRGSSNQRVIDVQKSIERNGIVLYEI